MGIAFFRALLTLGSVLLVLSLLAVYLVPTDDPAYVPAVLSAGFDALVVLGSTAVLWYLMRKKG